MLPLVASLLLIPTTFIKLLTKEGNEDPLKTWFFAKEHMPNTNPHLKAAEVSAETTNGEVLHIEQTQGSFNVKFNPELLKKFAPWAMGIILAFLGGDKLKSYVVQEPSNSTIEQRVSSAEKNIKSMDHKIDLILGALNLKKQAASIPNEENKETE